MGLIGVAALIELLPGSPLGLLTLGAPTPARTLLPSATVFLQLLSNHRRVLGPWSNSRTTDVFTSIVVALPVTLSVVPTAAVLFPDITAADLTRPVMSTGQKIYMPSLRGDLGVALVLVPHDQAHRAGRMSGRPRRPLARGGLGPVQDVLW